MGEVLAVTIDMIGLFSSIFVLLYHGVKEISHFVDKHVSINHIIGDNEESNLDDTGQALFQEALNRHVMNKPECKYLMQSFSFLAILAQLVAFFSHW